MVLPHTYDLSRFRYLKTVWPEATIPERYQYLGEARHVASARCLDAFERKEGAQPRIIDCDETSHSGSQVGCSWSEAWPRQARGDCRCGRSRRAADCSRKWCAHRRHAGNA